jgi:hypothetical protein
MMAMVSDVLHIKLPIDRGVCLLQGEVKHGKSRIDEELSFPVPVAEKGSRMRSVVKKHWIFPCCDYRPRAIRYNNFFGSTNTILPDDGGPRCFPPKIWAGGVSDYPDGKLLWTYRERVRNKTDLDKERVVFVGAHSMAPHPGPLPIRLPVKPVQSGLAEREA